MAELYGLMKTHHCGELNTHHIGEQVTVCGWVNKYRNLGGLHFIDLWDREGVVQLSFDEFKENLDQLKTFSLESVVLARGEVRPRPPEAVNGKMKTGQIEVAVQHIELLSPAATVPFLPRGPIAGNQDFRLKYRYLDLRTEKLQRILKLRSRMARTARETLYRYGFTEVETPILYKSHPRRGQGLLGAISSASGKNLMPSSSPLKLSNNC